MVGTGFIASLEVASWLQRPQSGYDWCLKLTSAYEKDSRYCFAHYGSSGLSAALAQDELALLNFVVIRDYNGKPIRNASVVMHPVEKNGKQSRGGLADQD